MSYTLDKRVDGEFDIVVERTTNALSEEGFGVLCDIDVQQTLKKKLDEDFRQYRILGACNPPLAQQALEEELQLGTLLPCNVVVYETDDGEIGVSAVDPEVMLSVVDNPELDSIAAEVRERFERVLDELPDA
ncbi:DUF302 domain-containing protein [Halobacterium sp. KA-6]|jgi:uncharacterized protein (DUF302 family)|uniref:DUF302 domain-containing protein n=1 Tax=Halobacterium sp. KA-6 TaxID=2896368 RepID=UPI001E49CE49|nr:DUF302 domain-containing protein [Halobacterium sp. KA-6]MCD2203937.1 DUF302 domain-containing protein [Halobacterium sp. KA-6]